MERTPPSQSNNSHSNPITRYNQLQQTNQQKTSSVAGRYWGSSSQQRRNPREPQRKKWNKESSSSQKRHFLFSKGHPPLGALSSHPNIPPSSTKSSKQLKSCPNQKPLLNPLPQSHDLLAPYLKSPNKSKLSPRLFEQITKKLPPRLTSKEAGALLILLQRNLRDKEKMRVLSPYEQILYKLIIESDPFFEQKRPELLELLQLHLKTLTFAQQVPNLNELTKQLATGDWQASAPLTQAIFLKLLGHAKYSLFGEHSQTIQQEILKALTQHSWQLQRSSLTTLEKKLFDECVSFAINNNNWNWLAESHIYEDISSWDSLLLKAMQEENHSAIHFYEAHLDWFKNSSIQRQLLNVFQINKKNIGFDASCRSAKSIWQTCLDEITKKIHSDFFNQRIASENNPTVRILLYIERIRYDQTNAEQYWKKITKENWEDPQLDRVIWKEFNKNYKKNKQKIPLSIYERMNQVTIDKERLAERLVEHLQENPQWKVQGLQLLIHINQEAKNAKVEKEICVFLEQLVDENLSYPQSLLDALFKRIQKNMLILNGRKRVLLALTYPQYATSQTLKQTWSRFEQEIQSLNEFPTAIKEKIKTLIQVGAGEDFVFIQDKFLNNPTLYGRKAPEILAQFLQKAAKERQKNLLNSPPWKKFRHYLQDSSYADTFAELLKKPKPQPPPFSWDNFLYEIEERPRQAATWLLQQAIQESASKEKALLLIKKYFLTSSVKHPIMKYFSPLRKQNAEALGLLPFDLRQTITAHYLDTGQVQEASSFILKNSDLEEFLLPLIKKALIQSNIEVVKDIIQKNGIEPIKKIIPFLNQESPQSWKILKKSICKTSNGCEAFLRDRITSNSLMGETPEEIKMVFCLMKKAQEKPFSLINSKEKLHELLTIFLKHPDDSFKEKHKFAKYLLSLWRPTKQEQIECMIDFFKKNINAKKNLSDIKSDLFYFSAKTICSIDQGLYKKNLCQLLNIIAPLLLHYLAENFKHAQDAPLLSDHLSLIQKIIDECKESLFFSTKEIIRILILIKHNRSIGNEEIKKIFRSILRKSPKKEKAKDVVQYLDKLKIIYFNILEQNRISDERDINFFTQLMYLFLLIPKEELIEDEKAHEDGMTLMGELITHYRGLNKITKEETLLFCLLELRECSIHHVQQKDEQKDFSCLLAFSKNICFSIQNALRQTPDSNRFSEKFYSYASSLVENLDFLFCNSMCFIEHQLFWIESLSLIFNKMVQDMKRETSKTLLEAMLKKMILKDQEAQREMLLLTFCQNLILSIEKSFPASRKIFWNILAQKPTAEVLNFMIKECNLKVIPIFEQKSEFWEQLIEKRIDILSSNKQGFFSDPLLTLFAQMDEADWKKYRNKYMEIYTQKSSENHFSLLVAQTLFNETRPNKKCTVYSSRSLEYFLSMQLYCYIQGSEEIKKDDIDLINAKSSTDIVDLVGKILTLKIIRSYTEYKKTTSSQRYAEKNNNYRNIPNNFPLASHTNLPLEDQYERFCDLATNISPQLCETLKVHVAYWLTLSRKEKKIFHAKSLWKESCKWFSKRAPLLDVITSLALSNTADALREFYTQEICNTPSLETTGRMNPLLNIIKENLEISKKCNLISFSPTIGWVEKILMHYIAIRDRCSKEIFKSLTTLQELKDISLKLIETQLQKNNPTFRNNLIEYFSSLGKTGDVMKIKIMELYKEANFFSIT